MLGMFHNTKYPTLTIHDTIMLVLVDPMTTSTITLVGGGGTVVGTTMKCTIVNNMVLWQYAWCVHCICRKELG